MFERKRQTGIACDPFTKPNNNFYAEALTFYNNESMQGFQHYHDHYEILYVTENDRIISVNDDDYVLDHSCIALIPPYIFHGSLGGSVPPQTRYMISFKEAFLENYRKIFDVDLLSCFNLKYIVIKLNEAQQEEIAILLKKMTLLHEQKDDEYKKIKCLLCLCDLLSSCTQIQSNITSLTVNGSDMTELIKYIQKNYYEDITLDLLSKRFRINKYKLSRNFKIYTGTNMLNYINKIRIENAKAMLSDTNMKITNIAGKTGFNNTTHFNRVFKEETGCSPSLYRAEYSHYTNK